MVASSRPSCAGLHTYDIRSNTLYRIALRGMAKELFEFRRQRDLNHLMRQVMNERRSTENKRAGLKPAVAAGKMLQSSPSLRDRRKASSTSSEGKAQAPDSPAGTVWAGVRKEATYTRTLVRLYSEAHHIYDDAARAQEEWEQTKALEREERRKAADAHRAKQRQRHHTRMAAAANRDSSPVPEALPGQPHPPALPGSGGVIQV